MLAACRAPRTAPRSATRRPPDGCAVETSQLASVVQEWVDRWDRDHDVSSTREKQRAGHGGDQAVGAVKILSERTALLAELVPGGVAIPKKTIENVLAGRHRLTELRIADALVAAVEQPEAFHDGTLRILPNPNAAPAVRASCCGGSSLNGSLA